MSKEILRDAQIKVRAKVEEELRVEACYLGIEDHKTIIKETFKVSVRKMGGETGRLHTYCSIDLGRLKGLEQEIYEIIRVKTLEKAKDNLEIVFDDGEEPVLDDDMIDETTRIARAKRPVLK